MNSSPRFWSQILVPEIHSLEQSERQTELTARPTRHVAPKRADRTESVRLFVLPLLALGLLVVSAAPSIIAA